MKTHGAVNCFLHQALSLSCATPNQQVCFLILYSD